MMTKQEVLDKVTEFVEDYGKAVTPEILEMYQVMIECLEHCIDEEESPCYDCIDKHCDRCIYSGRIMG